MAKRKRKADEDLTPEEAKRRRIQKELRELALKLRNEGKVYKPQNLKRKVAKANGDKIKGKSSKKDKKSKHDTPKWRPYDKVDVVILPIFWNMRHEEKAQIMKACEQAASLLQEAGIVSQTDASTKYTPGQKMKYWETAGVKVRVEIGPKEAASGSAVIARAGLPGTVAQKDTINLAVQLVREVKKALQEFKDIHGGDSEPAEDDADHGNDKQGGHSSHDPDAAGDKDSEQDADDSNDGDADGDEDKQDGTGAAAGDVGAKSNREKKREKKERKKAAEAALKEEQKRQGENVKAGSRRDRKRKAKEAAAAKAATEGGTSADGDADDATDETVQESPAADTKNDADAEPALKPQSKKQKAEASSKDHQPALTDAGEQKQNHKQAKKAQSQETSAATDDDSHKQPEPAPEQVREALTTSKPQAERKDKDNKVVSSKKGAEFGDGDDLGDDFDIDPEFLGRPEEEALTLTKTQQLKKSKKMMKEKRKKERYGPDAKAWDADLHPEDNEKKSAAGSKDSKSSKKAPKKIVTF